jgi:hypothetical protein
MGVSLSRRLRGKPLALALVLMGLGGCGAAPEQPHLEVSARKQVLIPVCGAELPPAKSGSGGTARVRSVEPDQWMTSIAPRYSPERGLSPTEVDCTGHYLFANEPLRGGIPQKGWSRQVDPDDLDIRVGPQGTRVLWLRALRFENGDEGGPIALVRVGPDRAEVVGIGSFRGPPGSQISPVRLGNEIIVSAESKSCPASGAPGDCQKRAQFYLSRRGRLIASATVDIERTAVVPSVTEQGLYAKYVLRTDVTYKPAGIQLLEHVEVKIVHSDEEGRDSDRALRKVEFSRLLRVERDALFPSNDPLWERVVGKD